MKILLANPRGFCAGVDRAIEIVNVCLERFEPPIYVRHEVVHNKFVVDDLREQGVIFIESLNDVPEGIRTPDRRLRRPLLYPAELRAPNSRPLGSLDGR